MAMQVHPQPPQAILRRTQVQSLVGLSRSTIYARIREGTFPGAVTLGSRSVGWRRGDIDAWLADPSGYCCKGGAK